jgi:hypothetical protein
MQRSTTNWSPDLPVPHYADRKTLAAIITHLYYPVSPRTIERWPLIVRKPNKKAILEVKPALEYAEQQLNKAYAYKQNGGAL